MVLNTSIQYTLFYKKVVYKKVLLEKNKKILVVAPKTLESLQGMFLQKYKKTVRNEKNLKIKKVLRKF